MIDLEKFKEYFDYKDGYFIVKKLDNLDRRRKIGSITGTSVSKTTGYSRMSLFGKRYSTHRLVWFYHNGYFPELIDHVDGNRSNNKIENLRESNYYLNSGNKHKSNSLSGFRGVYPNKRNSSNEVISWVAQFDGEHLGVYESATKAALVVDLKLVERYGKHAKLNLEYNN